MLAGTIGRGRSLAGFVARGLIEPSAIISRHLVLAQEMRARGFRHASDNLPGVAQLSRYSEAVQRARVDVGSAWHELIRRCPECRKHAPTTDFAASVPGDGASDSTDRPRTDVDAAGSGA
jgi:hypothetical protein